MAKKAAPKKKVTKPTEPWAPPAEHRGIGLRTVDKDYKSHGGFRWPTLGYCEAHDWDPAPKCGGGLHLLPNGDGDWGLLSWEIDAIAQICEYDTREAVAIDKQKIKVPRCNVLKTGALPVLIAEVLQGLDFGQTGNDALNSQTGYAARNSQTGNDAISMQAGLKSECLSGPNGAFAIAWHDGTRPRIAVGYVGEDGIEAGVWYKVVNGKITKA